MYEQQEVAEPFLVRLAHAMRAMNGMTKDGHNESMDYNFLSEAAVKRKLNGVLYKHQLCVGGVTYTVQTGGSVEYTDKKGNVVKLSGVSGRACVVKCELEIIDQLFPEEGVKYDGIGAGEDFGDKAPMKACAAALKYAITSGFLVGTGDDPENDGGPSDPEDAGALVAAIHDATRDVLIELKPRIQAFAGAPSRERVFGAAIARNQVLAKSA